MSEVRILIDSLSLTSGAVVLSIVSALFVWLLCLVSPTPVWKLWAGIVPLAFAYCLYWTPVWLGNDPSEYSAWQFVVIVPWFIAGVISSSIVVFFCRRHQKSH